MFYFNVPGDIYCAVVVMQKIFAGKISILGYFTIIFHSQTYIVVLLSQDEVKPSFHLDPLFVCHYHFVRVFRLMYFITLSQMVTMNVGQVDKVISLQCPVGNARPRAT